MTADDPHRTTASATTWDPDQYLAYRDERERPLWDLVARIPVREPHDVVDLGCGPGTATAALAERWHDARVVGIDHAPEMLLRAASLARPPRLRFEYGDIATFEAAPHSLDVIFSNAALHWVRGHLDLLGRWLGFLRPNGVLAFQVPGNFSAPSHALLSQLAETPAFRARLRGVQGLVEVVAPERYLTRLRELGALADVWTTTYFHVLSGADPVLRWVKGSILRPYLDALGPEAGEELTAAYAEALRSAYPVGPSGETVLEFRRVFVVATTS
jgi:trans-aconitate 2-methyltransferase